MVVARFVAGVAALLADWLLQIWAENNLVNGVGEFRGNVYSESTITLIQVLLLIAAALFFASAVLKFARMVLTVVAAVALLGGGVAGFALPDDELDWVRKNGCRQDIVEVSETVCPK